MGTREICEVGGRAQTSNARAHSRTGSLQVSEANLSGNALLLGGKHSTIKSRIQHHYEPVPSVNFRSYSSAAGAAGGGAPDS